MSLDLAILIAILSPALGIAISVTCSLQKKLPLYICIAICAICITIYVSFLVCAITGEHINSNITYTEYPIQKLTTNNIIYFDDMGKRLDESYVILEKPNEAFNNVVVVEKEKYMFQWICKVSTSESKYHVYLSEELYNRLQDGNVIYKMEE